MKLKVMFKPLKDVLYMNSFKDATKEQIETFSELWELNRDTVFEVDESDSGYHIETLEPDGKYYKGYFDVNAFQPALQGKLDKILSE